MRLNTQVYWIYGASTIIVCRIHPWHSMDDMVFILLLPLPPRIFPGIHFRQLTWEVNFKKILTSMELVTTWFVGKCASRCSTRLSHKVWSHSYCGHTEGVVTWNARLQYHLNKSERNDLLPLILGSWIQTNSKQLRGPKCMLQRLGIQKAVMVCQNKVKALPSRCPCLSHMSSCLDTFTV